MPHQPPPARVPPARGSARKQVLIVDDSAVVRQALADIIATDPTLTVMATAADPFAAAERLRQQRPDVIILDIEMPRMDGLTFLRKLMAQHPIPVVVCSSLVADRSETCLAALASGAVDVIAKPELAVRNYLEENAARICEVLRNAAGARVTQHRPMEVAPKLTADAVLPAQSPGAMLRTTEKIVAIGASTGGTEALRVLLEAMPRDCPPIVIVQHMPENFTAAFARRLDSLCDITVSEAKSGDRLLRGHALIAPGNRHTLLTRSGALYGVEVRDGPLVSRHRPSVDVLFRSVARTAGRNAVGVILTGMGDDGARGMKELRDTGAETIGQDEATSVVYGMPREAMLAGAVASELPLGKIAPAILRLAR